MTLFEKVLAVLGTCGGALVVIFSVWGDLIKLRLSRRYSLEDKQMARETDYENLNKKMDAFIDAQRAENREIRQRLGGLESSMNTVSKNSKALVFSDIYRELMTYIKQGIITPQDRLRLKKRVGDYAEDYGENDDLVNAMLEIENLRTGLGDG